MLNFLKKIFKKKDQEKETVSDINLACAIILLEVSYSDFEIKEVETDKMLKFFETDLNLSKDKSIWLNEEAQKLHKDTNCLRKYIKLINDSYTKEEKVNLINIAWRIARADNEIDKYEEHRIRKISELLYLNHSDFIKEKINTN
ncbi:MAG: TerB family tellurite resistance protein [Gammaproteobacteria bacterium]|jgi:uncharacterized tellurite resistance protein B-like protein|tara:strand:- start:13656 stop:14087 length:432 start_codon:yes stop_codon:yes gene_type:complete